MYRSTSRGSVARVMAKDWFVKWLGVMEEPVRDTNAPPEEPNKKPPLGPETEGWQRVRPTAQDQNPQVPLHTMAPQQSLSKSQASPEATQQ